MRLDQSSVDISSLIEKVERSEIDLQPDFQRGQVWPDSKKRRLIDTILRNWYVPAIHIVINDDYDKEEILDGQQRLRAIYEFMHDGFSIDGKIEPDDAEVSALHGLRFSQLPIQVKSRFRRFSINTVRLRDYKPEEPGELFFRLNQLTALTAAEQRNALVGAPRNQVRELVNEFENMVGSKGIGFSNSRMNYDDTLSRLAVTLEMETLSSKLSSTNLERRYRDGEPFPSNVYKKISKSLSVLSDAVLSASYSVRLNKASLFSWLFFVVDYDLMGGDPERTRDFVEFFEVFEGTREHGHAVAMFPELPSAMSYAPLFEHKIGRECQTIFNDRASSRVNDVTSVLLRDLCLTVAALAKRNTSLSGIINARYAGVNLEEIFSSLERMPEDVADRSLAESALAKRWEAYRAAR
ncbi:DUF262 domain-containing protein [Brevundimonas sp.]